MTDYIKASGNGSLMIRDLGSTVEYWVKPYYSDFYWTGLSFTVTANGSSTNYSINISGNSWVKVTSRTITSSQTTTFKLNTATGTTSLAGPTTFSQYIDRGTVPQAPDAPTFSSKTDTTMIVSFTDNGNGGLAIDSRQIGWAEGQPSGPTNTTASDGSTQFTGLVAGQLYSFWARVHNSKGWSGWSARSLVTMLRRPFPPSQPWITSVEQTSLNIMSTDGDNGGSAITSREFAYNTSNSIVGATIVAYDGNAPVTGLPPGRQLWLWARTTNVYGTSDWSVVATVTLIAGATITDAGAIKRAVPWVNVGGVWKVARPWSRTAGIWSKSAT